ncbi:MAG: hypothetical protein SV062_13360 [Thermodesulfobacteriota bacterium]|nr:hypothetical protein [Thermodesulfobacteriota bacterium]
MNPCEYTSSIKSLPIVLSCIKKDARCGYHKIGQIYKFPDICPEGLCPEAYHNLYYITLGILFNAKYKEEKLIVKCPGIKNYVVFEAGFEKLNLRFKLLNIVKKMLRRFYPGQIYQGRLFWEITSIKGECPQIHSIGSRFYINRGNFQITPNLLFPLGELHELCPAVFDNLFPYLYSWKLEKGIPYTNDSNNLIQCPDHKANITFKIAEISK